METRNYLEHLRHVETMFAIVIREYSPTQEQEATTSGGQTPFEPNEGVAVTGDPTKSTSTTTVSTSTPLLEQRNQAGDTKVQHHLEPQQQDGVQTVQETYHEDDGRNLDCIERISAQTQLELGRVALHASVTAMMAETFNRRRQSLAYLLYRGFVAVYRHARAGARRSLLWESAADIGRIKQLASSTAGGDDSLDTHVPVGRGENISHHSIDCSDVASARNNKDRTCCISEKDGLLAVDGGRIDEVEFNIGIDATRATGCPEAAGSRETRRATRELRNEANRVALRDKFQREVLRRSTREVTTLLAVDDLRRAPIDGGEMWSKGRQQDDGRYGSNLGAESIQVESVVLRTYKVLEQVFV